MWSPRCHKLRWWIALPGVNSMLVLDLFSFSEAEQRACLLLTHYINQLAVTRWWHKLFNLTSLPDNSSIVFLKCPFMKPYCSDFWSFQSCSSTTGSSCSKRPTKLPTHVFAGYIEVDKVSLCSHARGRNAAEGSQPQRRKMNVTQEIFGSSETNFGGIIWMKQTPARLSRLVHIFISKPFVFLTPFISSLVSSSGLLS